MLTVFELIIFIILRSNDSLNQCVIEEVEIVTDNYNRENLCLYLFAYFKGKTSWGNNRRLCLHYSSYGYSENGTNFLSLER